MWNILLPVVFIMEREDLLVTCILITAKNFHVLMPSDIRSLAYDSAKANDVKCPDSWSVNGIAGVD